MQEHGAGLAIDAAVELQSDRGNVDVVGKDRRIVVRADGIRSALALLRCGPGDAFRLSGIRLGHRGLLRAGLTAELRLGRLLLGRVGADAEPNLAARLAGIPEIELGSWGLALGLCDRLTRPSWQAGRPRPSRP